MSISGLSGRRPGPPRPPAPPSPPSASAAAPPASSCPGGCSSVMTRPGPLPGRGRRLRACARLVQTPRRPVPPALPLAASLPVSQALPPDLKGQAPCSSSHSPRLLQWGLIPGPSPVHTPPGPPPRPQAPRAPRASDGPLREPAAAEPASGRLPTWAPVDLSSLPAVLPPVGTEKRRGRVLPPWQPL